MSQSPVSHAGDSRSRNRVGVAVLVAAGVIVIVAAGYAAVAWSQSRSRQKALTEAGNEPRKIIEAAAEGKITPQQRDQAINDSIQSRLQNQVDGYFRLPEGKERDAYLDRVIDEQELARQKFEAVKANHPLPTTGPDEQTTVTTSPDGREKRITIRRKGGDASQLPPDLRAKLAEFAAAMAQRRAERGLPPASGNIVFVEKRTETVPQR